MNIAGQWPNRTGCVRGPGTEAEQMVVRENHYELCQAPASYQPAWIDGPNTNNGCQYQRYGHKDGREPSLAWSPATHTEYNRMGLSMISWESMLILQHQVHRFSSSLPAFLHFCRSSLQFVTLRREETLLIPFTMEIHDLHDFQHSARLAKAWHTHPRAPGVLLRSWLAPDSRGGFIFISSYSRSWVPQVQIETQAV